MPSGAIASYGTLLKIGDGGGTEVFTTIAEVRDIKGPTLSMETKEVTNQTSTGAWKEYVGTLLDGGEVTFDINFIPTETTHKLSTGLLKDMSAKTKRNFKLVFPDTGATTWAFSALIVKFDPDESVTGELKASVSLKISGQPTLA